MLINFLKTKWRRRIFRKQFRFFFGIRTTTGRNFAPRTKNEKDSENIYKNGSEHRRIFSKFRFFEKKFFLLVDALFRKMVISKKSFDAHFIFIYIFRIFLVFCSRCKSATGSGPAAKKKIYLRDSAPFFSKNLSTFFSCALLTLVYRTKFQYIYWFFFNEVDKMTFHFALTR